MKSALATCVLLLLTAFSLATDLTGWHRDWSGDTGESSGILTAVLGDSRRLFAKYIYSKADAYFHSGYYPSTFDEGQEKRKGLSQTTGSATEHHDEHEHHDHGHGESDHAACEFLGQPRDWIDRFSRNFFPSEHRHLGEGEAAHGSDKASGSSGEREILPWFRLAAEMDPNRPETYVVAAYWLRSRLNRVTEAEQFLREGLRSNPAHPELLFELGRIYQDNHKAPRQACNIWELALSKLEQQDSSTQEANLLLHAQLLGNLAKAEEQQQDIPAALRHLTALKMISPHKDYIEKWIQEVKAGPSEHGPEVDAHDHDDHDGHDHGKHGHDHDQHDH